MTAGPNAVANLEAVYGAPSQAAFGSAVFSEKLTATDNLAQAALAKYRYFVGDLWERYGEQAWMGPWREVYTRKAGADRDIAAELRAIDDADGSSVRAHDPGYRQWCAVGGLRRSGVDGVAGFQPGRRCSDVRPSGCRSICSNERGDISGVLDGLT